MAKGVARRIIGRPIIGRSILVYHRIAKADFDPWNIAITPGEFQRQLIKLRSKTVLPLQEFARLHMQNRLPRDAVAITFDDGYACNALVAAPMLEAFGYPATFFVVSDAILRAEEFWWDQLERIYHAHGFSYEYAIRLLVECGESVPRDVVATNSYSIEPFLALWRLLRDLSANERCRYLSRVQKLIGVDHKTRETHRPMTATELRALASNSLFEIGGHTATHPSLPTLNPAEQEQEITSGSRTLEALIEKPIRSFAYPFGDWAAVTPAILRRTGFECAVTAEHRRVRSGDNQFELPRRQALSRNARMLEKREVSATSD